MERIFSDLEAALTAPRFDWRPVLTALAGNLLTGVAIGLGIAAGMAFAG
ncbi:hypothetical protein [Mesorhizobium sp. KR9-304]